MLLRQPLLLVVRRACTLDRCQPGRLLPCPELFTHHCQIQTSVITDHQVRRLRKVVLFPPNQCGIAWPCATVAKVDCDNLNRPMPFFSSGKFQCFKECRRHFESASFVASGVSPAFSATRVLWVQKSDSMAFLYIFIFCGSSDWNDGPVAVLPSVRVRFGPTRPLFTQ